jgi:hypothetical protein
MGWLFYVILGATALLLAVIEGVSRREGANDHRHTGRSARRDSTGRGGLAA